MMWQKKLKHLKKTTSESQLVSKKTAEKPSQADDLSFQDYCGQLGIQPLVQDTVMPVTADKTRQRQASQRNLASNDLTPGFDFIDESNAKSEFYRHGQRMLPKQLRLGKFIITATLDLHHYSKAHALTLLERLLDSAMPGATLKVIHGQGTNSEHNQPILQAAVRKYLEQHSRVLAFTRGEPNQGGNGVTLIKLCN